MKGTAMSENKIHEQPPPPERLFWRQAIQEMRRDSLARVEGAARLLIGLVTLVSVAYVHALATGQVPPRYFDLKVLFVGPLAIWGLCALAGVLVLFPRRFQISPSDPEAAERTVTRALRGKYRLLMVALLLLVVSLGWLAVAAWVYLDVYVAR
jgi:hypothetical protein